MSFDIEGARKEGYSDAEIAEHLAKQRKFDVGAARSEGYSDAEILEHLSRAKPAEQARPARSGIRAFLGMQPGIAAAESLAGPAEQPSTQPAEQPTASQPAPARAPRADIPAAFGIMPGSGRDPVGPPRPPQQTQRRERGSVMFDRLPGEEQTPVPRVSTPPIGETTNAPPEVTSTFGDVPVDEQVRLGKLGDRWRDVDPTIRGVRKGIEVMRQQNAGLAVFFAELGGADQVAGAMRRGLERSERSTQAIGEQGDFWPRAVENGIASIVGNVQSFTGGAAAGLRAAGTGKAASAVTKATLGTMGALVFGDEYQQGRAGGLDIGEATARATMMATAEIVGERVGLKRFVQSVGRDVFGQIPTGELPGAIARYMLAQQVGEQVTTGLQFGTDKFSPVGLNPEATLADYIQQVADTAGATLVQTAVMGGGAQAASALMPRRRGEPPLNRPPAGQPPAAGPVQTGQPPASGQQQQAEPPPAVAPAPVAAETPAPAAEPAAPDPLAPLPQAGASVIAQFPSGPVVGKVDRVERTGEGWQVVMTAPDGMPYVIDQNDGVTFDPAPAEIAVEAATPEAMPEAMPEAETVTLPPPSEAPVEQPELVNLVATQLRAGNEVTAGGIAAAARVPRDRAVEAIRAARRQLADEKKPEAATPEPVALVEAPAKPVEESDQDRSNREWAENWSAVTGAPALDAVSTRNLERAEAFGARQLSAEKRKGWDGGKVNQPIIDGFERELGMLRAELKKRRAAAEAPKPAEKPPAEKPAKPAAKVKATDRPAWFQALPKATPTQQAGRVAALNGKPASAPRAYLTDESIPLKDRNAKVDEWMRGWSEATAARPVEGVTDPETKKAAEAESQRRRDEMLPPAKAESAPKAEKTQPAPVAESQAPVAASGESQGEGRVAPAPETAAPRPEPTPDPDPAPFLAVGLKRIPTVGVEFGAKVEGKPGVVHGFNLRRRGGSASSLGPSVTWRLTRSTTFPGTGTTGAPTQEVGVYADQDAAIKAFEAEKKRLQPAQETVAPAGIQSRWDKATPADRRDMLRAAGYTDADQARALSGLDWNQLTDPVRRALDGKAAPIKQASPEPEQSAPQQRGPTVIINRLGPDGLTDAERAAGKEPYTDPPATEPNLEAAKALLAEQKAATGNPKAEAEVRRKARNLASNTPQSDEKTVLALDMIATRLDMGEGNKKGLEFADPAPAGGANTIFTEDAAAAARERLRKKLSGRLTSGIDPEMMQDGITLAGYHIERGARSFAAFTKAMVADLGDAVRPYLKSWYMGAKYDPRAAAFSEGMSSAAEVEAASVEAPPVDPDSAPAQTSAEDTGGDDARGMDQPGRQALEDAPADPVQGTEEGGDAGAGTARGGRADRQGDGGPAGRRPGPESGVGNDPGEVPFSPGGIDAEGPGRGRDRQPGVRGDARPESPADGAGRRLTPGEPVSPKPQNYTITDADQIGEGGAVAKFNQNIAAIELLKKIEAEARPATTEEQGALAKYVGWGGLKEAFRPKSGRAIPKGWERRVERLEALLTPQEYEAANRSILDAHYTSVPVVRAMWDLARHLGFAGGRVQETSMGTGNFFGLMPADLRGNSTLTGVELDSITGRIAKVLYPQANILNMGYQDARLGDGYFDLTVGNPPFGDQPIPHGTSPHLKGFSIHNYMFAKAIDKLAPGGLHVQVVSHNFLDSANPKAREYIAHRARLVAALRLPRTAFKSNAGTEVVTDIVVLQKLPQAEWGTADSTWVESTSKSLPTETGQGQYLINRWIQANPDAIIGRESTAGSMYRADEYTVEPTGDLEQQLREAIQALPAGIFQQSVTPDTINENMAEGLRPAEESREVGVMFVAGDALYKRVENPDGSQSDMQITAETPWSEKQAWGDKRIARAKGMAELRDLTRRLLAAEASDQPAAKLDQMRKRLNGAYDRFVAAHGFVNDRANEQVFRDDPDAPLVAALEADYDAGVTAQRARSLGIARRPASAKKMPIFTRRVVEPYRPPESAENSKDAFGISLSEKGRVDLAYMARLTGQPEAQIIEELTEGDTPAMYLNPQSQTYEPADQYLSGNVKAKHREAMAAGLEKNADALRAVFPPDLKSGDLFVKVGAPWVAESDYEAFIEHLSGPNSRARVTYFKVNGSYAVTVSGEESASAGMKWGTGWRSAADIVSRVMNGKELAVYDTDPDGKRVLNKTETDAAMEKANEIAQEFDQWLFADADRRERLVAHYNEHYNTNVEPKYDGSILRLPGKVPDEVIKLRRHQLNAVWRIVRDGRALLDHVVGSGKTFTVISAAMELRRMGLAKKPMVVVPNHLVEQWAADFYRLYPGAKLLAMRKADFERKNRQRVLARIATGDWDAVVIAHSSFGFIKNDQAIEESFISQQIAEIQAAIDMARAVEGKKGRTERNFQKQKEKLETRLSDMADKPKDDLLTFQELGVDQLMVDEAHEFKNLYFMTQRRGVGGFGNPEGSKKAFDLFMKTQWLQRERAGRGVVFATGTPVSNSLTELYTVQRYLGMDELQSRGLNSLDSWLNTFGSIYSDYELDGTGVKYKRKERLRELTNVPEVMALYRQFADSVTLEDIQQNYRDDNDGAEFPIPKVKGGKRQNVVVPRSSYQGAYFASIVARATNLKAGGKDNMLAITTDARKAALDMRLVDREATDEPGSKTHMASDNIHRIWEANRERKGTQLVFLDLSVPLSKADGAIKTGIKRAFEILGTSNNWQAASLQTQWANARRMLAQAAESTEAKDQDRAEKAAEFMDAAGEIESAVSALDMRFSVYDDMRQKLLDRGVPASEIAFIHDFDTDAKKQDLFDAVNAGVIRVVFGSTAKMGAGTNVQRKLVALHHMDAPWRPSDIEQREGRIIRQGNEFRQADPTFEVEILAYATEQTYDARMWQVQEQKLIAINSLRAYNGERELEDVSSDAATAAEMKAAASGNPLILEDVQLTERVRKLKGLERKHRSNDQDAQSDVRKYERQIRDLPAEIKALKADEKKAEAGIADPHAGNPPKATIDGKVYTSRREAEAAVMGKITAAREAAGEGKRAAWSVTLDGREYSNQDELITAIGAALGDAMPFRMTVGGNDYIQRAAADRAIQAVVAKMDRDDTADLGEMYGLRLTAKTRPVGGSTALDLTVSGEVDHRTTLFFKAGEPPTGMARSIEKEIARIGSYRRGAEDALSNARESLEPTRALIGQPFKYADELAEKRERLKEVKLLLSKADEPAKEGDEEGATLASIDEPVQIETPAFKRWFGDSKVVDADGKPLVVYHGTVHAFAEFDAAADPYTYESDRGKQFFLDSGTGAGDYALGTSDAYGGNPLVMPVYLRIENPRVVETDISPSEWWDSQPDYYWRMDVAEAGHDGLIVRGADETMYVTSDPKQIKSAIGNDGTFNANDPSILSNIDEPAPWYYSVLADAVSKAKMQAAPASQWKAWLDANAAKMGVKADEIEWSGVREWLAMQPGKVSREAIAEYLSENGVRVEDVVLGGEIPQAAKDALKEWLIGPGNAPDYAEFVDQLESSDAETIGTFESIGTPSELLQPIYDSINNGATKFSVHTLPGGKNYREVLLTLPTTQGAISEKTLSELDANFKKKGYPGLSAETRELLTSTNNEVFEMLDDWEERIGIDVSQARAELSGAETPTNIYRSQHWDNPNIIAHIRMNDRTDADGSRVLFVEELQSDWGQQGKKEGFKSSKDDPFGTPIGPFVSKTEGWLGLALKRVVAMAAAGGYDRVAFVNGQQSAERYDLSKRVSRVSWEEETQMFYSYDMNGKQAVVKGQVTAKDLQDLVGKEVAERLIKAERTPQFKGDTQGPRILSGLDLKIGHRGMRKFYDEIVPQVAKDVVKRLGGKVGRGSVEGINDSDQVVIEITPAMREQVMRGMPLFSMNQPSSDIDRSAFLDRLARLVADVPTPPVRVAPRLRRILREADKTGKIDADAVQRLLKDVERRNEDRALAKGEASLERGPLWVRERLLREIRRGDNPQAAKLALWMLDQNPAMAEGLAISFRQKGQTAGTYDEAQRLATIIAGASEGTAVHEILHHTERMMPADIQAGIRAEWARQLQGQLEFAQRNNLEPLVRAITTAMSGRPEDAGTLIEAIRAGEVPFSFYQFVNPSEFWAVNGTRLMMERAQAPGWVARARRWLQGFIETIKEVFGLASDAPVLRALDAVLKSDGAYLQRHGLASGMQASIEPANVLDELAKVDDLFQIPRSDKATVEELAAELSASGLLPEAKVRSTQMVNETLYTITYQNADGKEQDAKLWVRRSTPNSVYAYEMVEGEAKSMQVGRPGDNPEDVPDRIGEVYLDVSRLREGSQGNALYHLASTFAHNTGRIFIGDPSGLSDAAMRRRLDNMISTALKYGTTEHIAPHPDQIRGRAGVPGFRWTYGDHVGNIERMIKAAVAASDNDARLVQFRPSDGTFRDSSGGVLGADALRRIVASRPVRAGAGRSTTLARNAILRSLVSGEGAAGPGGGAQRVGTLERLVHVGRQSGQGSARGIFYSIDPLAGESGKADGKPSEKADALRQAVDGMNAPPRDPVAEWAGPIFKDMGAFSKYAVHPRTIAAFDRTFTPVYRVAEQQIQTRDRIASQLATKAKPYLDLSNASKDRVNAALELGRLKGEVLAGDTITNTGQPAQLSENGEVITLSATEKEAYSAVREMLSDALDRFRDQALRDFGIDPEKFPGPGISRKLVEAAKKLEAAGGNPKQADTLRTAAQMVDEIEQARRTGYVPFARFGDVVVAVKDPDGETLWASKIDTGGPVNWARKKLGASKVNDLPAVRAEMARLKQQFAGQEVRISAFQPAALTGNQGQVSMSDLDTLAEVAQVDNAAWDDIRDQLERAVKAKGFRRHFFGAQNTPGYSTDFERSISDYMLGLAGYLARREAMPQFEAAIGAIPAQKPNLIAYAQKYRDYMQSPSEEWQRLRQFGFFMYLAGVPATAFVNLTQVDLVTAPYLMQFANPAAVEVEVQKARLEAGAMLTTRNGMDLFDPDKAPKDVAGDLQSAWDDGFFVPLNTYELMGTAYTGSRGQRTVDRASRTILDAVAITFTLSERHNRIATFIAAHRLARRPGFQEKAGKVMAKNALARSTLADWSPRAFAEWTIDETHYRMGKVNRPTITRGIGAPLLQFKGFTLQTLERWATMYALQGPQGKAAMLTSIGAFALLSGFWGLPGADDLRDLVEKFYRGITGKDLDSETKLREAVVKLTGSPALSQAFSKGITFPAGLDLSGRIGMGNIAPDTPLQMLGIPADLFISRPTKFAQRASQDNWGAAFAELAPNFIKNPLMAASWADRGVSTIGGRRVMTPDQLDRSDIALRSIGFQPSKVTNERERQWAERRASTAMDERRRDFYVKISQSLADEHRARERGDEKSADAARAKAMAAYAEIAEHNAKVAPHERIELSNDTLRRRIAQDIAGPQNRVRRQARGRAEEIREIYGTTR